MLQKSTITSHCMNIFKLRISIKFFLSLVCVLSLSSCSQINGWMQAINFSNPIFAGIVIGIGICIAFIIILIVICEALEKRESASRRDKQQLSTCLDSQTSVNLSNTEIDKLLDGKIKKNNDFSADEIMILVQRLSQLTSAEKHAIHSVAITGGEIETEIMVELPNGTRIGRKLKVKSNGYTSTVRWLSGNN